MKKRFEASEEDFYVIDRRGLEAQLLKDSPVFQWAIEAVYHKLVTAEDSITGDAKVDPREANDARRNFSGMRVALVALVEELDTAVHMREQYVDNNNPTTGE